MTGGWEEEQEEQQSTAGGKASGVNEIPSVRHPASGEAPPLSSTERGAKRSSVRRSLPCVVDSSSADLLLERTASYTTRDVVSEGNSPVLSPSGQPPDELDASDDERRRPRLCHKALPSLHLNARCLKCDRVGTVYCKGCEAHFCAKHDQRRHRFMLRKDGHEYEELPGISYFRIPLPNTGTDKSGPPSEIASDESCTPRSSMISSRGTLISAAVGERQQALNEGVLNFRGGGYCGDRNTVAEIISDSAGAPGSAGRAASGVDDVVGRGSHRVRANGGERGRGGGGGRGPFARPAIPRGSGSSRREPRRPVSAIDLARSGWYDKIVMAIVRPPRCQYSEHDLGPFLTPVGSLTMMRRDFVVRNRRGLNLVCSHWRPSFAEDTSQLPCVVYLHGNSSARVDVVRTRSLTVLVAAACTVVAFDFSGSGMSEGDWVTLGYFEQHDVADVLAYLRSNGMANRYLLWGRSMGAASALLYAERYPNSDLCGLILDSPFCSFKRLAKDLVTQGQVRVPGFLVNGALAMLRRSVRKRTRCDLKTVAPIDRARHIQCPSLFIAARKDVMVRPSHGADLSDAVGGASLFITCRGTHNTSRPGVVLAAIGTFVKGCFRSPEIPITQAFEAIEVKLAEAQATAAALKAGRPSSSAALASNESKGNARGSSCASGPVGSSLGFGGVAGRGEGDRTVTLTAEVKSGQGGSAGVAGVGGVTALRRPPFAPGAPAARAALKDPAQKERTLRASSFGGTEARPSSRASSWDSNESGGYSSAEHRRSRALSHTEQKQMWYARGKGRKSLGVPATASRAGTNSGVGKGGGTAINQMFPQPTPSWRDTIFDERPGRTSWDEQSRGGTWQMTPSPTHTTTAAAAAAAATSTLRTTSIPKLASASHDSATLHMVAAARPPQTASSSTSLGCTTATTTDTLSSCNKADGKKNWDGMARSTTTHMMKHGAPAFKGSGSAGADAPAALPPETLSAKSRANERALEIAKRQGGRGSRGGDRGRGIQHPYLPAMVRAGTAYVAGASANPAASDSAAALANRLRPQPPPTDAVHLVLSDSRPRPAGVSRPGPKAALENVAGDDDDERGGGSGDDVLDGSGPKESSTGAAWTGATNGKGATGESVKRRLMRSGPVRRTTRPAAENATVNDDGSGGSDHNVRRSMSGGGAIPARVVRRAAASTTANKRRGGMGATSGAWWGRIRVKTPGISGFRTSAPRGSRYNGAVCGFPNLGGNGRDGGGARHLMHCPICANSSSACMCSVEVPMVNDGGVPPRRPSMLRTESGKLKM